MRYVVAYLKAGSLLCHHTPAISQPLSGQLYGWLPLSCPAGATAQHEIIHEHSCFIHAHSCVPLVASGKAERVLRRRHKYICPRRNLPIFRRPSGAVVGRRLYRGVAPACIPPPLRGYCGSPPIQGRCPCLYSVAPPGLLLGRESPGGATEYRQGCNPCSCGLMKSPGGATEYRQGCNPCSCGRKESPGGATDYSSLTGALPLPVFRRPSGAVVGRRLYRGDAPACIPSPLRGYCGSPPIQGRCPCLDDWGSPSSSAAPPGLLCAFPAVFSG
jgi:hypothetical protein